MAYRERRRCAGRIRWAVGPAIIECLGGKRIHPGMGVSRGCEPAAQSGDARPDSGNYPGGASDRAPHTGLVQRRDRRFRDEIRTFGNSPTLFLGLVDNDGTLNFYDGKFRVVDAMGRIVADGLDPAAYNEFIGETVHPWSYLKSTRYLPAGNSDGVYRVGPLARLNLIDRCGTPLADQEWAEFRELERGAVLSSFYYHYARLIEVLYSIERMQSLLEHPEILNTNVRAVAQANAGEGVGVSEAPRGSLIHHYRVDGQGLITWANLVIATGHNNAAMNHGVLQVARHYVHGTRLEEGMLNRVEAVIRAFDPCLSCSTHALGRMALEIELHDADGTVLDRLKR